MQDKATTGSSRRKPPTGIIVRHSRSCRTNAGGTCNCQPAYRAFVYDRRSGKKTWKTFPTLAAAKGWRADATSQLNAGRRVAPSRKTLREAAAQWLEGATASPPTVLSRGGTPYKPSVLRSYERALRRFVLDDLGAHRLSDIRRGDLQGLVDRLLGKGLAPATVRNVATSLRVIFRHAVEREELAFNPAAGLRLPNGHKPRDRAASATEAADLLAALPESDRPLWATAFYAGLRRGELRALRWEDVDLADGIIHVRHGWDDLEGEIAPKSKKGARGVPITALLRDYLVEHKARTRDDVPRDFVFGNGDRPFSVWAVREHALKAWERENEARAEKNLPPLKPILLHECRHTFVSLMADAGIPLERVGDYVGHSSTWMVDRYRHLLEGHEQEAARLLDAYLARADTDSRIEQLEAEG
jgi:integrase